MPNIDQHKPGSFCWFELGTTDQSAAKNFYGSLFGWTNEDFPMGPSGSYTTFSLNGRSAAAAYTLNEQQKAQGVPPHWMLYISVENVDTTTQKASELGGQVFVPAFDVMDLGRMSVMADPTGATFSIWHPKQNPGVGITGVDGTVCWADLSTADVDKGKAFYSDLFNWKIEAGQHDPSGYLHIINGDQFIGGIPPSQYRDPNVPPHWLLYFATSDCAASLDKAKDLGATVLLPLQEIPNVGTMAILKDPQGAVFALFQPPADRVA